MWPSFWPLFAFLYPMQSWLGWFCRKLLGHICLYAYMHKVNPNIFRYFLRFYSCITFISLFAHRSNFFRIFRYFSCHFIHFKSLSFWHGTVYFCFRLSARVPARRVESKYIICNARAHLGALSGVEAGGGNSICGLRHPLAFSLLSVLTVTEEVRTYCFFSSIVLINCIIVSIRYYCRVHICPL